MIDITDNVINFQQSITIEMTLGHALLAWQSLSENFSDLNRFENLDLPTKKSIWTLTDLLESALINNHITGKPENEWLALIEKAKDYMKAIEVEFVNELPD